MAAIIAKVIGQSSRDSVEQRFSINDGAILMPMPMPEPELEPMPMPMPEK